MEVVSEYRALRASVLQLWRDSGPKPHDSDVADLTRFNESIDQSLVKAVSSYSKRVDQAATCSWRSSVTTCAIL
jgi:hypothetical protein